MNNPYTVTGTYGSQFTRTNVYVYPTSGGAWYTCEGSVNVNLTLDDIADGVNVEELRDHDAFTASEPINSLDELIEAVES